MVLTFYRTTTEGSVEIGRATLAEDGKVHITDKAVRGMVEHLLEGVDQGNRAAVEEALRKAPVVFDGAYLRAGVEE